jgi:hypothetical protein
MTKAPVTRRRIPATIGAMKSVDHPRSTLGDWTNAIRLVFRHGARPPADEPLAPVTPRPHEIEFVAYAEDCTLSGRLALSGDRLSDLLNANERLLLVDVLVADLAGGNAIEVHELQIQRDELLLVHATGPRGHLQRRTRTRQHPIVARLGPYEVQGYIHALPGSDPIAGLRRRGPMVVLTDAVIRFTAQSVEQERRVSAVMINRELADWVAPGVGETDELATLEMPTVTGPLVKDFTGSLLSWDGVTIDVEVGDDPGDTDPAAAV